MASSARHNIPRDKFLLIAINLLHRNFIEAGRTRAKRLFREIHEGRAAAITSVTMEDDSTVRFKLSLDHSEFGGHLNFSTFRAGLTNLLGNISRALQDKQEVRVFSMEHHPGSLLFGITGVTVEGDRTNVLALGADTQGRAGTVTLRLMYLDPRQFTRPEDTVPAASGQSPDP